MIPITTREKQILRLITEEYTMREISQKLFISTHTVIAHRENIKHKLHARNTAGLVRKAYEHGILTL